MSLFFGKNGKVDFKKFLATLMITTFMAQSMMLNALAVDINYGAPSQSIQDNNDYNVWAQYTHGTTDFRNYDQFNLDQVLNLIYSSGSNKFVNLVNGQININGVLNTMKDNNFFNGHAIFVSPQGMVVGASGVLNVGSLSVITPVGGGGSAFETFWNKINANTGFSADGGTDPGDYTSLTGNINPTGVFTLHGAGKIFARNGVDINAGKVDVSGTGGIIIAGLSGLDGYGAANYDKVYESAFDALVSGPVPSRTADWNLSNDGKIVITAADSVTMIGGKLDSTGLDITVDNSGASAATNTINIGNGVTLSNPMGDININNTGGGKINIDTNLNAENGSVTIQNGANGSGLITKAINALANITLTNNGDGGISTTSSALTSANGNISITSAGGGNISTGAINAADGTVDVKNTHATTGSITTGNIAAKNKVTVSNSAVTTGGITTGTINSSAADIEITNNAGNVQTDILTATTGITVNNNGTNSNTTTIGGVSESTSTNGNITITSKGNIITNALGAIAGKVILNNTNSGTITVTGAINAVTGIDITASSLNSLTNVVLNTGTGTINLNAAINAVTGIDITAGLLNSAGSVVLNNTGTGNITVSGAIAAVTGIDIDNTGGSVAIANATTTNSTGDITIDSIGGISTGVLNSAKGIALVNNTSGDIIISGTTTAATDISITNNGTSTGKIDTGNLTATSGAVTVENKSTGTSDNGVKVGNVDAGTTVTLKSAGKNTTTGLGLKIGNLTNKNGNVNITNTNGNVEIALINTNTDSAATGVVAIVNNDTNSGTTTITGATTNKGKVDIKSKGKVTAGSISATAASGDVEITSTDGIQTAAISAGGNIKLDNSVSGNISTNALSANSGAITIDNRFATGTVTLNGIIQALNDIKINKTAAAVSGLVTLTGGTTTSTNGSILIDSTGGIQLNNAVSATNGSIALGNTGAGNILAQALETATGISVSNSATGGTVTLNGLANVTGAGDLTISSADAITTQELRTYNGAIGATITSAGTGNIQIASINANTMGAGAAVNKDVVITNNGTGSVNITNNSENKKGRFTINSKGGVGTTATLTAESDLIIANTTLGAVSTTGVLTSTNGKVDVSNSSGGNITTGAINAGTTVDVKNTNGSTGNVQTGAINAGDNVAIINSATAGTVQTTTINTAKEIKITSKNGISTQGLTTTGTTGNNSITVENDGAGNITTGTITTQSGAVTVKQINSSTLDTGNILVSSISVNNDTGATNSDVTVENNATGTTTITNASNNKKGKFIIKSKGKIATNAITADTGNIEITSQGGIEPGNKLTAGGSIILSNTILGNILTQALEAATGISVSNSATGGTVTLNGLANVTGAGNLTISSANAIETQELRTYNGAISVTNNSGNVVIHSITGNTAGTAQNVIITNNDAVGTTTISNASTNNGLFRIVSKGKVKTNNLTATAGNVEIASENGIETEAITTQTSGSITLKNTVTGVITTKTLDSAAAVTIDNQIAGGNITVSGNIFARGGDIKINKSTPPSMSASGLITVTGTMESTLNNIEIASATGINLGNNLTAGGKILLDNINAGNIITKALEAATGISVKNTASGGNVTIEGLAKTTNASSGDILIESINGITTAAINSAKTVTLTNATAGEIKTSGTIDAVGKITINNTSTDVASGVTTNYTITSTGDDIEIKNSGGRGITTNSAITADKGNITIENVGILSGAINLNAAVTANQQNTGGSKNITIKSAGTGGIHIKNAITNWLGNIIVNNNNGSASATASGINITNTGSILAKSGAVTLQNTGEAGINITGSVKNENGNIALQNNANSMSTSKINITGTVSTEKSNGTSTVDGIATDGVTITNAADGGIDIAAGASVVNKEGKITISNTNTMDSGINIAGTIQANESLVSSNAITVTNSGSKGINLSGVGKIINKRGNITVTNNTNTAATSGINIAQNTEVTTEEGALALNNAGAGGITVNGTVKNRKGAITITNTNVDAGIKGSTTGLIQANDNGGTGTVTLQNTGGAQGIDFEGNINNLGGDVTITSTKGGIALGSTANPTTTGVEATGVITVNNSDTSTGSGGVKIRGKLITSKATTTDSILITNNGEENIDIEQNAKVQTDSGNVAVTNNGTAGVDVAGLINVVNQGNISITNAAAATGKINIKNTGRVATANGNITITNNGSNPSGVLSDDSTLSGINIDGNVISNSGTVGVTNNGTNAVITGSGTIEGNSASDVTLTNANGGKKGINFLGMIRNRNGNVVVANNDTSATSGIIINSIEANMSGNANILTLNNNGGKGITIKGAIRNFGTGGVDIRNADSKGADAVIYVTNTGSVETNKGDITIRNVNNGNIIIENKVETDEGDIVITNTGANTIIGYAPDNSNPATANKYYLRANKGSNNAKGNVVITQNNGDILNAGVNRTLIYTQGNLKLDVTNGNIGDAEASRRLGLIPGSSIAGTTRGDHAASPNPTGVGLYTESINIHVEGDIEATATNTSKTYDDGVNPTYSGSIINLRSKNSDMRVKKVVGDYIMLTAADWANPDDPVGRPTPNHPDYFKGYSIINATNDGSTHIQGKHISLISSDTVGVSDTDRLVINPETGGSASVEAENNIYITNQNSTNVRAKLYAKSGDIYLMTDYNPNDSTTEDVFIDEITCGGNLTIVHLGRSLTIYNLGVAEDLADDLLYPHDGVRGVIPDTINISVLDVNGGNHSKSVLTIYNAQVKGANRGQGEYLPDGTRKPDVILRADVIIANDESAPASSVPTVNHPNGYNPTSTRAEANAKWATEIQNYLNNTGSARKATGFKFASGVGEIVFDIRGVDPDLVESTIADYISKNSSNNALVDAIQTMNKRQNYNLLILPPTQGAFPNPYYNPNVNHYGVKTVYLSTNSMNPYNRGVNYKYLYADDAYVDSKDLNFSMNDAIITRYGEFRNGNKGGTGGYTGTYRWTVIVDNDFKRHLTRFTKLTLQLYSQLTGSFNLSMGNNIVIKTSSPTVFYDPHEVSSLVRNENSFSRLTFKDDKIQELTTRPDFDDIDKDTYKPTKRDSLRFSVEDSTAIILVSNKIKEKNKTVKIYDMSKGGLAIEQDGNLAMGDKLVIKLSYGGLDVIVDAVVVRVNDSKVGLKFVNMDKATANKILYMNMLISKEKPSVKVDGNISKK